MDTEKKYWDDHCATALAHFYDSDPMVENPIKELGVVKNFLSEWVRQLADQNGIHTAYSVDQLFNVAGCISAATLKGAEISPLEMHALLVGKQHDYGHENITATGRIGLAVRIIDKIARLINLTGQDVPVNETLEDTWKDILGYAVVYRMFSNGEFVAELKPRIERNTND